MQISLLGKLANRIRVLDFRKISDFLSLGFFSESHFPAKRLTHFWNYFRARLLHTKCVAIQIPEKSDIARPAGLPPGGKMHLINGDLVPDS